MSGQRNKTQQDIIRHRNEYYESLNLQTQINEMNLEANRVYKATGQLPPSSLIQDTRTVEQKLLDFEGLKIGIIKALSTISSPDFGANVVQKIINNPLNVDNSLLSFTANRINEIVKKLSEIYSIGIKGDSNDIEQIITFICKMYSDNKNFTRATKEYSNSTPVGALNNNQAGYNLPSNYDRLKETLNESQGLLIRISDELQLENRHLEPLVLQLHPPQTTLPELIQSIRTVCSNTWERESLIRESLPPSATFIQELVNFNSSNTALENNANTDILVFSRLYLDYLRTGLPNYNSVSIFYTRLLNMLEESINLINNFSNYLYENVGNNNILVDNNYVSKYKATEISVQKLFDAVVRFQSLIDNSEYDNLDIRNIINEKNNVIQAFFPAQQAQQAIQAQQARQGGPPPQGGPRGPPPAGGGGGGGGPPPNLPQGIINNGNLGNLFGLMNQNPNIAPNVGYAPSFSEHSIHTAGSDVSNVYSVPSVYSDVSNVYSVPSEYSDVSNVSSVPTLPSYSEYFSDVSNVSNVPSVSSFGSSFGSEEGSQAPSEAGSESTTGSPFYKAQTQEKDLRTLRKLKTAIELNSNETKKNKEIKKLELLIDEFNTKYGTNYTYLNIPSGGEVGVGLRRRGRPRGSGIAVHKQPKPYKLTLQENTDISKGIEPTSKFVQFGKYLINNHKLNNQDILTLKHKSGNVVLDFPTQRLSKPLSSIIKGIVGGALPHINDVNKLTEPEKMYLHKICLKSNILDKLNIPTPNKDYYEKELHNFEVMKGEIMSGNDSVELIKKFKILILKLAKNNILPKKEVSDILEELLHLGY